MKFRTKITLCMICILSILFGIGSTAFISISFQSNLDRREESAKESYQFLLSALQILSSIETWSDHKDVSKALEGLTEKDISSWFALKLSSKDQVLYEKGVENINLDTMSDKLDTENYLVSYKKEMNGTRYIQLSSVLIVGEEPFNLTAAYDISPIYQMRNDQQKVYYQVFLWMICFCALFSYSVSWLLTRPLSKLSKSAKEIALGNLSSRSNIRLKDEVGSLSKDFDSMAIQVEKSVLEMKKSMEEREQFIGSFIHELKTPMTSIIGYADLLRRQDLDAEEQIDATNYIFSEAKRLESLSLKLLDIFVVDHGNISLTLASPSRIIGNIVDHLEPIYKEQNITLEYLGDEGSCMIETDLFQSLILNLLDNARKSLDSKGKIQVHSNMTSNGCNISIKDNGKGIPKDSLKYLTNAFYRVDKSRARAKGGVGLGLTICAKIIELHNGTINFTSEEGVGTIVMVALKGGKS